MPKTSIYQTAERQHGDVAVQQYRIEVGWNRLGGVQVGTTRLADGADPTNEYLPGTGAAPTPAWAGQFIDLDRSQLNMLIRTLRKARDEAYGRDE